jgi:hypothetical protein
VRRDFNSYTCAFLLPLAWLFSDMLKELARREKEAGIFPDSDIDIFMKVKLCALLIPTDLLAISFENV